MYKITGKTYDAKDDLRKAGYVYDNDVKAWVGSSREPFDALVAKWTRPGYGVRYATMAKAMRCDEFSVVTCEI